VSSSPAEIQRRSYADVAGNLDGSSPESDALDAAGTRPS
jgi:hypothetical protein